MNDVYKRKGSEIITHFAVAASETSDAWEKGKYSRRKKCSFYQNTNNENRTQEIESEKSVWFLVRALLVVRRMRPIVRMSVSPMEGKGSVVFKHKGSSLPPPFLIDKTPRKKGRTSL